MYIKRKDAMEVIYKLDLYLTNSEYFAHDDLMKAIPAADVVEVRHGRWIDKGWYGDSSWQIDGRGNCWRVHECSECNVEKKRETTKYCPHCGAKMDL